jgi:hypothetical protein
VNDGCDDDDGGGGANISICMKRIKTEQVDMNRIGIFWILQISLSSIGEPALPTNIFDWITN